jgi:hypothetical protein
MTPSDTMTDSGADPMAVLLDRAHAALTHADYADLGPLTAEIEAELARLEISGDVAALLRVQTRALRNETCLLATQRGFRAARRRVEEIKAARSGLVTYDTKGRRAEPHPTGELTRRF